MYLCPAVLALHSRKRLAAVLPTLHSRKRLAAPATCDAAAQHIISQQYGTSAAAHCINQRVYQLPLPRQLAREVAGGTQPRYAVPVEIQYMSGSDCFMSDMDVYIRVRSWVCVRVSACVRACECIWQHHGSLACGVLHDCTVDKPANSRVHQRSTEAHGSCRQRKPDTAVQTATTLPPYRHHPM